MAKYPKKNYFMALSQKQKKSERELFEPGQKKKE
jgi:hypothetical protein